MYSKNEKGLDSSYQNGSDDVSFSFRRTDIKDANSVVRKNAKILKALRKTKGYTLYDLSKLSGLSPSYLSRLEASARRLNTETLNKLALALGCREDDFFKDDVQDLEIIASSANSGFQKNLPVYRVISEGVDISDNPYSVIILNSAMDYTFRPPKLSSSNSGFAIYAVNDLNSPRYRSGDVLFFDSGNEYRIGDTIMLINSHGYLFIGGLASRSRGELEIKHYSNNASFKFEERAIEKMFKLVAIEFQ